MLVPAVIQMCVICRERKATQRHHLFAQTKANRRTYGSLIDEDFNLIPVCDHCHVSHKEMAGRIMGELWFRAECEKHGFPVPKMSKTLEAKIRFGR